MQKRVIGRVLATFVAFISVASTLVATPSTASAESANVLWLTNTYEVVFGRAPDDGGLDYWLGQLAGGGDVSRERVARAMLFSVEGARNEVERAYVDLLSRSAEPEGKAYWTNYLQGNAVSELRTFILGSREIMLRTGTMTAWLDLVYNELIGRDADPVGREYWLGLIDRGLEPALAVDSIYRSEEALQGRVEAYYQEVLGRSATVAERMAGADLIRRRNERTLRANVLALDEAFEQYLSVASSTDAASDAGQPATDDADVGDSA